MGTIPIPLSSIKKIELINKNDGFYYKIDDIELNIKLNRSNRFSEAEIHEKIINIIKLIAGIEKHTPKQVANEGQKTVSNYPENVVQQSNSKYEPDYLKEVSIMLEIYGAINDRERSILKVFQKRFGISPERAWVLEKQCQIKK